MTVNFASRARWGEYSPAALGWSGKWDPEQHPELLTRFTFTTSRGEILHFGSMHRLLVPIFREFYTRLDRKHPGVLHGDPDEGCYNPNSRTENGSRSFHTYAIATDTEWNNNPMGVGVHRSGSGALPDDTGDIGRPLMIQWGGTWTSFKDYMHNEFHGTPQDAIDLARALEAENRPVTPTSIGSPFPYRNKPGHVLGLLTGPARYHGGATPQEKEYVGALVHALRRLNYFRGPSGTDVFNESVRLAVIRFQKEKMKAKRATGTVGLRTWLAARREVRKLGK